MKTTAEQSYIEVQALSLELIKGLAALATPYVMIRRLSPTGLIRIENREQSAVWAKKSRDYLANLSRKVAPNWAIPILLQMLNDCYYGKRRDQVIEFGVAVKLSLAFVSENVFRGGNDGIVQKSLPAIQRIILAAHCFQLLRTTDMAFGIYSQDGDFVEYNDLGAARQSANFRQIAVESRTVFSKRGASHRTLTDAFNGIWKNLSKAAEAIENVLNDDPPNEQEAFNNTLLSAVPVGAKLFWEGLWARVGLAIKWIEFHKSITKSSLRRILVFAPIDATLPPKFSEKFPDAFRRLLWDTEWYDREIDKSPDSMIVERPVLTLSREGNMYATSFLAIADSLNWFIEASVLCYPGEGARLPGHIFQKYVSRSFEESAIQLFRSHGFLAGRVSDKGSWHTQNGTISLSNHSDARIPGEIDVLAHNPNVAPVTLVECKVLGYPKNERRLRNILAKFQEADSEGFQSTISKKLQWIKSNRYFTQMNCLQFAGMILLDRKMPGMFAEREYPIIDFDTLKQTLSNGPRSETKPGEATGRQQGHP